MKFDRNKCLMLGIILLLLGVQFRLVGAVTLTPEATGVLAKYVAPEKSERLESARRVAPRATEQATKQTLRPPRWLGLSFISVGAVLVLQSFVMPRPQ